MAVAYAPGLWRVCGVNLVDVERLTMRQFLALVAHVEDDARERREAERSG